VANNHFAHNGFFGNPTNGDIANGATGALWAPTDANGGAPDPNCYSGNTDAGGLTADPPGLQALPCGVANSDTANTVQLLCATGATTLFVNGAPPCPNIPVTSYPQRDAKCTAPAQLTPAGDTTNGVCFLPLSYTLSAAVSPSMPDPCAGVPANAYCAPANSTVAANAAATSALPGTGADRAGSDRIALALVVVIALATGTRRRGRRT
jgi:hypothetical protein